MCTFTKPILYANQDFDEYSAAVRKLGADHVEWFMRQSDSVRQCRTMGAWFANDLSTQNAYHAVERWHGLTTT